MKKTIFFLFSLIMLICFAFGMVGCDSLNPTDEPTQQTKLTAPILTKNFNKIQWTTVQNANGYVLRINGDDTNINTTEYTFDDEVFGEFICSVKAVGNGKQYLDSNFSNIVTVVIDKDESAPEISFRNDIVTIDKNSSFTLSESSLCMDVDEVSQYSLSYSVLYNGIENVQLVNNTLETAEYGFYIVNVTAKDSFNNESSSQVTLGVEDTYINTFSSTSLQDLSGFVANITPTSFAKKEIKEDDNGNSYLSVEIKQGQKITFNFPLATSNGVSLKKNSYYNIYMTCWSNIELEGTECFTFSAVSPMVLTNGVLDADNQKAVFTSGYTCLGDNRISTFYVENKTGKDAEFYFDNIMLVEQPSWEEMPVYISQGSNEVDENGYLTSVFSRADSAFRFYPESIANCEADETIKVTIEYKITSEKPMADSRGALGSYIGGTLFLTPNSNDYLTVTFDTKVNTSEGNIDGLSGESLLKGNGTPNFYVVFIAQVGATISIKDVKAEVYPSWSKMKVDSIIKPGFNASDEVDEDGNFKSVFTEVWSDLCFYPEVLKNCVVGDVVRVNLEYKIVTDKPTADKRGALVSYSASSNMKTPPIALAPGTLVLETNSNDFIKTGEFDIYVKEVNGKKCLELLIGVNNSTTLYIKDLETTYAGEPVYGFISHTVEKGLGGNTVYMLPSTTGMQTLSFIIKNTSNELFVIDGGYDSSYNSKGQTFYDCDLLFNMLKDLSDGENPVVKGWFFTHPHTDHYTAFNDVMDKYSENITIQNIYYSWSSEESWYSTYSNADDVHLAKMGVFAQAVTDSNANVINPETGDEYDFGSFKFNILYSPEMGNNYPFADEKYGETDGHKNANNLSIVIKMTTSEKSILFLGDAGVASGNWLLENCSKEDLKADIVQMAHHGQSGVDRDVYAVILPEVALFNCDEAVYNNTSGRVKTLIVRGWLTELNCNTNYCSKDGIFVIK